MSPYVHKYTLPYVHIKKNQVVRYLESTCAVNSSLPVAAGRNKATTTKAWLDGGDDGRGWVSV